MRKFDRKAIKEDLVKAVQESEERKESGDFIRKYFKDDVDVKRFVKFGVVKTGEDPHIIDIIPWECGNNMPIPMNKKEGQRAYVLDIYVHQNIGPMKRMIVCPAKNYGNPCPICEHIEDLVRAGKEWEDYQDIAPKRRCIYNIVNMTTTKEERKGVQIWEVSYNYSEKQFLAQAKNARGGGSIPFASIDQSGRSISFIVENNTYKTISGHKLVERDYEIPDEILEQSYNQPLDQLIEVLSYKEIAKIFLIPAPESAPESDPDDVPPEKGEEEDDRPRRRGERERPRREDSITEGCPAGGIFGEDCDSMKDCDSCKSFDNCSAEADRLEEERKKQRAERTNIRRRNR